MISNPKHGWCNFKLGNFEGAPSYLTNVPIDLLDAFIDYYEKGNGVVVFDEEGSYFILVLSAYNWDIYIIDEKEEYPILHRFDFNIKNLAYELINDIEDDLDNWVVEFNYEYEYCKDKVIQNKKIIKQKIEKLKVLVER